jgi:membrane protein required for colicin V production
MLDAITGWDWFVATVVVLSVGFGLMRGLVRTVFALAAWGVGLLGVPLLSPHALRLLPDAVPHPVVYFLVFLVLFVAVRMLGSLAARGLRGLGLGGVDRLLGAALGTLRAAIVILLAALGTHLAGYSTHPSWTQALSRPLLDGLVQRAEPFLPERLSGVRKT